MPIVISDIALKIVFALISVLIVTAICVYNYLSFTSRNRRVRSANDSSRSISYKYKKDVSKDEEHQSNISDSSSESGSASNETEGPECVKKNASNKTQRKRVRFQDSLSSINLTSVSSDQISNELETAESSYNESWDELFSDAILEADETKYEQVPSKTFSHEGGREVSRTVFGKSANKIEPNKISEKVVHEDLSNEEVADEKILTVTELIKALNGNALSKSTCEVTSNGIAPNRRNEKVLIEDSSRKAVCEHVLNEVQSHSAKREKLLKENLSNEAASGAVSNEVNGEEISDVKALCVAGLIEPKNNDIVRRTNHEAASNDIASNKIDELVFDEASSVGAEIDDLSHEAKKEKVLNEKSSNEAESVSNRIEGNETSHEKTLSVPELIKIINIEILSKTKHEVVPSKIGSIKINERAPNGASSVEVEHETISDDHLLKKTEFEKVTTEDSSFEAEKETVLNGKLLVEAKCEEVLNGANREELSDEEAFDEKTHSVAELREILSKSIFRGIKRDLVSNKIVSNGAKIEEFLSNDASNTVNTGLAFAQETLNPVNPEKVINNNYIHETNHETVLNFDSSNKVNVDFISNEVNLTDIPTTIVSNEERASKTVSARPGFTASQSEVKGDKVPHFLECFEAKFSDPRGSMKKENDLVKRSDGAKLRPIKDNADVTEKNRSILAARVKNSLNEDIFKLLPPTTEAPTKPLTAIQMKFKETQELLNKQLRSHVKASAASTPSATAENGNGTGVSGLADRLGKLENAAQDWKKRVGPTDAIQFSVAGRMKNHSDRDKDLEASLPLASSPNLERKKKVPKPTRFKSKSGQNSSIGTDSSESEENGSTSPVGNSDDCLKKIPPFVNGENDSVKKRLSASIDTKEDQPKVEVPSTYDDNFSLFFSAVPLTDSTSSIDVLSSINLDDLKPDPSQPMLIQRRTTKVQRRREASRNPLKVLAARKDLKREYTEIKTGVAENEMRRLNVEKLSKQSNLAVEALAGLASKEDFTAVSLRKPTTQSNAPMLPYKNLMLLLIKGRRHVQTRLVEPTFDAINKGDTYVLVTPNEVFLWLGEFSNVIERSRGAEVAGHIIQAKDLGCINANHVTTIIDEKPSIHAEKFWTLLGAPKSAASNMKVVNSGHLDEDEIYEISLTGTNMIYEVEGNELVPVEKFWGNIPKIEMLDSNKILVFDFGTELYIWNGKNASMERRKVASKLAQELWDEGYNYSDCDISPMNAACNIGSRSQRSENIEKTGKSRPSFALIGKVTQHMETVLFREKFLDWPDFNRVIRTKSQEEDEKLQVANLDIRACDTQEMVDWKQPEVDLVLEGSHLGRGTEYFDEETRRFYEIKTTNVTMWRIEEFESAKLPDSSVGQFYSGDSYIVQWLYTVSVTGRELSGMPSKHNISGRDRCAYFCWQGRDASLNEQGAAALLTIELDKERGPQVRIIQGYESPAFLNLFNGSAVIHRGRRSEGTEKNKWRLFILRGELENEALLVEVVCNIKHLRSRGSFILLNAQSGIIMVWHGTKSSQKSRSCSKFVANNLKLKKPSEFGFDETSEVTVTEVFEGEETQEFFNGIGGSNRQLYHSLLNEKDAADFNSMRLFHLSSMLGVFQATPIVCHIAPFLQQDLYSASQPALFLLDTSKELWLWQGWWPVEEDSLLTESEGISEEKVVGGSDRGAVAIRWQAERRAAMETALKYWKSQHCMEAPKAHLVWAGLEPIEFTNLFPEWIDRDDVAELNIRDGRKACEILTVESELMRLTKSTYPPSVLLQRPLPEGVDPTHLELYLEPKHFKELLGLTKEEFLDLPLWKQNKMKKDVCLF